MKDKILQRLRAYASHYSFIKVINLICFYETNSLFTLVGHELSANNERLITSEIAFLIGLWVDNVNYNEANWSEDNVKKITQNIYDLLDKYHQTLKKHTFGEIHKEVALYEGDGAYIWQYIDLAEIKYKDSAPFLLESLDYDLYSAKNMFDKLYQERNRKFLELADKGLDNINELDTLFTYDESFIKNNLTVNEKNVLNKYITVLGDHVTCKIDSIATLSEYHTHPIIKLPDNTLFIPNLYILAKAINECPFYWLNISAKSKELRSKIGGSNENIAYSLLCRAVDTDSVYKNIVLYDNIKKKFITDIDTMAIIDGEIFIFQIKSKKLTQEAVNGNVDYIQNDFKCAVLDAYNQGILSVNALQNAERFQNLKDIPTAKAPNKYHIICLTGDYYPTIAPMAYQYQGAHSRNTYPLVAMTMYDLESITYMFRGELLKEYLLYRESCSKHMIYFDNEIILLGKFFKLQFDPEEPQLYIAEKLPRDYGVLMDIYIQSSKSRKIDCDAFAYFDSIYNDEESCFSLGLIPILHSLREKPRYVNKKYNPDAV